MDRKSNSTGIEQSPAKKRAKGKQVVGLIVIMLAIFITIAGISSGEGKSSGAKEDTGYATAESDGSASWTTAQKNAVKAAQNYVAYMHFSEQGLLRQLTSAFDGFSAEEAEFAIANISVDWNAEAVEAAQSYLNIMAFSRSALKRQLTSGFDLFTEEQADYALQQVYDK